MKDMVAKMLGKKTFKPIESSHPKFGNVIKEDASDFHVITENSKQFKSRVEGEKTRLKSKLPKPKKLEKINLGSKFR